MTAEEGERQAMEGKVALATFEQRPDVHEYLQASMKGFHSSKYHPRSGKSDSSPELWKRQLVLEEILSSEKDYVRLMRLLQQYYVEPLQELKESPVAVTTGGSGGISRTTLGKLSATDLDSPDVAVVFRSVKQIVSLNASLLEQLEQRLLQAQQLCEVAASSAPSTPDNSVFPATCFNDSKRRVVGEIIVGDLLDAFAPLFRMYSVYATCHAGISVLPLPSSLFSTLSPLRLFTAAFLVARPLPSPPSSPMLLQVHSPAFPRISWPMPLVRCPISRSCGAEPLTVYSLNPYNACHSIDCCLQTC